MVAGKLKNLKYMCAVLLILAATPSFTAQASVNITAPVAVVMCHSTGDILYDRYMSRRWVPASMTKSLTAFITYEEIEAGNLSLDTYLRVSANAARFSQDRRVEGSFVPLQEGADITVDVLLQLTMLSSANAACVVLAEHISGSEEAFVERMNQTAYRLGMYTSFTNSHGAIAHHSDALSTAILVREFITRYPDILRITSMSSMRFGSSTYQNTNRLLPGRTMPFDGMDGFKTGSLRAAGWNHSVTAVRDGRRIIAVVMGTPNVDTAHREVRTLVEHGFAELAQRDAERLRQEQEAADRVRLFYDSILIPLTSPAVIIEGELFLPFYAVFRPLGFELSWDSYSQVATATHPDGRTSSLFVSRPVAFANGNAISLELPARIIENRVYVPLQFIEAVTGASATWDMDTGVTQFLTPVVLSLT